MTLRTAALSAALPVFFVAYTILICDLCEKRLDNYRRENARLNTLLDNRQKEIADLNHALEESSCDVWFQQARQMCCTMQLAHLSTCEPGEGGEPERNP